MPPANDRDLSSADAEAPAPLPGALQAPGVLLSMGAALLSQGQGLQGPYPSVIESLHEAVYITDPEGRIVACNAALERLTGYQSIDLLGRPSLGLYLPEAVPRFLGHRQHVSNEQPVPSHLETEMCRKDGTHVPVEMFVTNLRLGGQIAGRVVVLQALTERTQIEESLRQAQPSIEQRAQERTAELLAANAALAHEIAERTQREQALRFLADASAILTSSLDSAAQLDNLAQLIVPAFADWCVIDMLHADGMIHRLASAHADHAKAGLVHALRTRYPILSHDAEHTLIRVLRTGQSWFDPAVTETRFWAEARDRAHGELLQALGFKAEMVVPLLARGRVLGTITCVLGEGARRYGPADVTLAEELARRAALAIDNARLYEDARATQEALQQARDVLEQRVQERTTALAAANEALRHEMLERQRAEEERRQLEHAAQRAHHFALLGRLAAGVSHEIRNPLGALFLQADLLEEELTQPSPDSPAEITQALAEIKMNLARLDDLVQDYLSLVRVATIQRTPQDLGAALQAWAAEFERLAAARQVQVHCEGIADLGEVTCHSSMLYRALLNLVQNALDAMPRGGTVTLAGAGTATHVQLQVRDTGSGMAGEHLEQIFEPLYTTKPGGTGLGLYIVQEIVAAHGGQIMVHSTAGQGTTFTITLPRAAGEAPTASGMPTQELEEPQDKKG